MKTLKISRQQFEKYVEARNSGVTNMCDVAVGAKISGLTLEVYTAILRNFTELSLRFATWPQLQSTILNID